MTLLYDITLILLCVSFFALTIRHTAARPLQSRKVAQTRPVRCNRPTGRGGAHGDRR
ncbi:MAG: hypothetical protein QNJ82_05035 [Gammaproteobacteria bacterium]|nr:hypothetical protein [Gammaproteobacteria bacterium]